MLELPLHVVNKNVKILLELPLMEPTVEEFEIKGWIVSDKNIQKVFLPNSPEIKFVLSERPDVNMHFPSFPYVKGFYGKGNRNSIRNLVLLFHIYVGKKVVEYKHVLLNCNNKRIKHERIKNNLICPKCKVKYDYMQPKCKGCGEVYFHNEDHFNFITERFRKDYNIEKTENVAATGYNNIQLSLVNQFKEGLILDCGCGSRSFHYPNVINFEIADYPSTDVMGGGESLPFCDETFDAVFSNAVLEHTINPFLCAKELVRVLKKGGILYCVAPFLQPFHSYPNHYFNMSSQGLSSLFRENMIIKTSDVPPSGHPIFALTWILQSWAAGLEPYTKSKFLQMRIADFMKPSVCYMNEDFVEKLPKEKQFELACTTHIIGEKK